MSEKPVIVQRLPGRITSVEARSLFDEIQSSLQGMRPRVVFDLSDVCALDVKGVGMLLRCLEIVMKENGDLKLAAIPQKQELLCEMSRLDGLFETFETTREAVESFHNFSPRDLEFNSQLLASNLGSARLSTSDWRSQRATIGKGLRITNHLLTRLVSAIVVLAMLAASGAGANPPQQVPASQEQPADPTRIPPSVAAPQTQPADSTQPNSASPAPGGQPVPDSPGAVRSQPPEKAPTPSAQQPPAAGTPTPLGTAAAELTTTSGVAASKPAGSAFAPAKQHRVRTIVISMGAILGAGIAIGTVAALSQASPSKPPGAH